MSKNKTFLINFYKVFLQSILFYKVFFLTGTFMHLTVMLTHKTYIKLKIYSEIYQVSIN